MNLRAREIAERRELSEDRRRRRVYLKGLFSRRFSVFRILIR